MLNILSHRRKLAASLALGVAAILALPFFDSPKLKSLEGWTRANARSKPTECYKVVSNDTPIASKAPHARSEVWCYRDLESPAGARLVYSIDEQGRTRPELTVIVEADGTLGHASLLKGQLSIHRLRTGFNPTGAPLIPPKGAERVPEPISTSAVESLDGALAPFQELEHMEIHRAKVEEGTLSASVPTEALPWRGYWYPLASGRMHNGDDSPMAKYDRFVARRGMTVPGAQKWEKTHHYYDGVLWSGHCNGWAAASILHPEPTKTFTDPYTGITFTPFDIKGLWTEHDYCPRIAVFGHRYWGHPDDDITDIHPADFHNAILYFIGELKKPLQMDDMANEPVENRVVSAYSMKIQKAGHNAFNVEATLKVHAYDNNPVPDVGPAPSTDQVYRYTLYTDNDGIVKSGTWISRNPDFFWTPLAPAPCDDANAAVDDFWVNEILKFAK